MRWVGDVQNPSVIARSASDEAIQFFLVVFSIASLAMTKTWQRRPYTFSPPSRMTE